MTPSPATFAEVAPSGPYPRQTELPWNWGWEMPWRLPLPPAPLEPAIQARMDLGFGDGTSADPGRRPAEAGISLNRQCEDSARRAVETRVPGADAPMDPTPAALALIEHGLEAGARERAVPVKGATQLRAGGQVPDAELRQRQAQKLEVLGTLAGGIAHDFNNILTAIISFAEMARIENPDNAGLQEHLRQILLAGNRATGLVRRILSFSRMQKAERRPVQLGAVIEEALELLRSTLPSTIVIQEHLERGLPDVMADPTQIHQVMMNLATNAAHAMRGRQGRLTVELRLAPCAGRTPSPHVELRARDYLHLTIRDTGHGMDEATLRRLFEPYFTTKAPGEGTGLGLAMVRGILQEHEGVISVSSKVGVGTTFDLYLPSADRVTSSPAVGPAVVPRGRGERILVVDDEPAVCTAIARMLGSLGYEAVSFRDPVEARGAFERDAARFHAVLTDLTMPGLTGLDLARALLATRPETPVILCSGYGDTSIREADRPHGIRAVLQKPIDRTALATAMDRVLHPPA